MSAPHRRSAVARSFDRLKALAPGSASRQTAADVRGLYEGRLLEQRCLDAVTPSAAVVRVADAAPVASRFFAAPRCPCKMVLQSDETHRHAVVTGPPLATTDISPLRLAEEVYTSTPWKLLVTCCLLNQTTAAQVTAVLPQLFDRWPSLQDLAAADTEELASILHPLGLHRTRAARLRLFAAACVGEGSPTSVVAPPALPVAADRGAAVQIAAVSGRKRARAQPAAASQAEPAVVSGAAPPAAKRRAVSSSSARGAGGSSGWAGAKGDGGGAHEGAAAALPPPTPAAARWVCPCQLPGVGAYGSQAYFIMCTPPAMWGQLAGRVTDHALQWYMQWRADSSSSSSSGTSSGVGDRAHAAVATGVVACSAASCGSSSSGAAAAACDDGET